MDQTQSQSIYGGHLVIVIVHDIFEERRGRPKILFHNLLLRFPYDWVGG